MLTPLEPADAVEMVRVLASPQLYRFTGGSPPDLAELEARYRFQVAPRTDHETWHNWILRLVESRQAIGFVQATVVGETAEIAWVVGEDWHGRGYATEAAIVMCEWLAANGVVRLEAHIHPEHVASERVAATAGLIPTGRVDDEGELIWASQPGPPPAGGG